MSALGPSVTTGDHLNILDFGPPVTTQDRCVGTYVQIPLKNGEANRKTFKTRVIRTDGTKDTDLIRITCTP